MKQNIEKIINWLRTKVVEANANGLVVGVSGGLDSAVVANLIKQAYPENSLGVIMPLKSNARDMDHAQKVVDRCQIDAIKVDLTDTHTHLMEQIKNGIMNGFNHSNERLADANLRARLRMSTLYTIATNYNYLVVGTDNKAEWYTGYFTKYGDGGVDLLPIVDFTKGEVRETAQVLGVPEEVIEKNPSADLWEGQTDEDEMGISYNVIDAYLKGEKILEQDQEKIEKMHQRTEHKRNPVAKFQLD